MRKIALFVEGQTEMLFVDRLIQEIASETGLAVEHAEASGGASRARQIKILKRHTPQPHHRYYVLIVNCSGDSKVKSDILDRYHSLKEAGYSMIAGLRDVYGQFRYEDVPRLRRELQVGLPQNDPPVSIFLAVMEIEAWFIAEYSHFQRIDRQLTVERIRQKLHFDPSRDDLEKRWHPAEDLDRIYDLAEVRYTKQRANLERTLDAIDYRKFIFETSRRFADAERLISTLKAQLTG